MIDKKEEMKKYVNLKSNIELFSSKKLFFGRKVKNPYEELYFFSDLKQKKTSNKGRILITFSAILLLFFSTFFNSLFLYKIDPVIISTVSKFSFLCSSSVIRIRQITFDFIYKPYVVTFGNYQNFEFAKEEAIKLLPKLRQIDIKKLPTGNYTFEIQRFRSKEKAYSFSGKFKQDDFGTVNVRYLPTQ